MRLLDLFNQVDDHVVAAGRSLLSMETKADGHSRRTAQPLQHETRREPSASSPARRQSTDAGTSATGSELETIDCLLSRVEQLTKRLVEIEGLLAKSGPTGESSTGSNGDRDR